MGSFYVNACLKGVPKNALAEKLGAEDFESAIGPEENGWICFSSEPLEYQDPSIIDDCLTRLSSAWNTKAVVFLNHDDDMLFAGFFDNGKQIGDYNSSPGNFMENPTEDDMKSRINGAEQIAAVMAPYRVREIVAMGQKDQDEYVFALEAHGEWVKLLGLPEYSVGFGHRYARGGDWDHLAGGVQFVGGQRP